VDLETPPPDHAHDDRPEPPWPYRFTHELSDGGTTTFVYTREGPPPDDALAFEHDQRKRLFSLTAPGGKTEHFRDNPARYLMVEPDTETGAMLPVVRDEQPLIVYLCREERQI
jgi:hypothetical protein